MRQVLLSEERVALFMVRFDQAVRMGGLNVARQLVPVAEELQTLLNSTEEVGEQEEKEGGE